MNHLVVVDASVAIKWLVEEEFSAQAEALLEDAAGRSIVGPLPLTSEVANALYQRTRRKDPATRLTPEEAERALAQFLRLRVRLVASDDLYQQGFAFARTHQLPNLYDSLYVVLAQMLGADLWTDDRVLLGAVGQAAPWVRPISDYPLPMQRS
jgi:predicted nucleic acid-binding protein